MQHHIRAYFYVGRSFTTIYYYSDKRAGLTPNESRPSRRSSMLSDPSALLQFLSNSKIDSDTAHAINKYVLFCTYKTRNAGPIEFSQGTACESNEFYDIFDILRIANEVNILQNAPTGCRGYERYTPAGQDQLLCPQTEIAFDYHRCV